MSEMLGKESLIAIKDHIDNKTNNMGKCYYFEDEYMYLDHLHWFGDILFKIHQGDIINTYDTDQGSSQLGIVIYENEREYDPEYPEEDYIEKEIMELDSTISFYTYSYNKVNGWSESDSYYNLSTLPKTYSVSLGNYSIDNPGVDNIIKTALVNRNVTYIDLKEYDYFGLYSSKTRITHTLVKSADKYSDMLRWYGVFDETVYELIVDFTSSPLTVTLNKIEVKVNTPSGDLQEIGTLTINEKNYILPTRTTSYFLNPDDTLASVYNDVKNSNKYIYIKNSSTYALEDYTDEFIENYENGYYDDGQLRNPYFKSYNYDLPESNREFEYYIFRHAYEKESSNHNYGYIFVEIENGDPTTAFNAGDLVFMANPYEGVYPTRYFSGLHNNYYSSGYPSFRVLADENNLHLDIGSGYVGENNFTSRLVVALSDADMTYIRLKKYNKIVCEGAGEYILYQQSSDSGEYSIRYSTILNGIVYYYDIYFDGLDDPGVDVDPIISSRLYMHSITFYNEEDGANMSLKIVDNNPLDYTGYNPFILLHNLLTNAPNTDLANTKVISISYVYADEGYIPCATVAVSSRVKVSYTDVDTGAHVLREVSEQQGNQHRVTDNITKL